MSLSLDIKKRYPGFSLDVSLEAGEERVALLGRLAAARAARYGASRVLRPPMRGASWSTA